MYLFIFISLFLHDYLLYNSNLIQKSDHVELPGADAKRQIHYDDLRMATRRDPTKC